MRTLRDDTPIKTNNRRKQRLQSIAVDNKKLN